MLKLIRELVDLRIERLDAVLHRQRLLDQYVELDTQVERLGLLAFGLQPTRGGFLPELLHLRLELRVLAMSSSDFLRSC